MSERILIVDDDPSFRRVVEYSLQEQGYETSSFGDPEEAFREFLDSEFALVVTDMYMPKLNGLDLISRMQAIVPDVPIIIVTGHPEIDDAMELIREAGSISFTSPSTSTSSSSPPVEAWR